MSPFHRQGNHFPRTHQFLVEVVWGVWACAWRRIPRAKAVAESCSSEGEASDLLFAISLVEA